MERRICEYCGTEYPAAEPKCPACGSGSTRAASEQASAPKRRLASTAGARTAGKKNGKSGPWGAVSVVLAVLVLVGIAAFFIQMDFFREGGFDFNAIPTKVQWTETSQAENTIEQQPEASEEEQPEEEMPTLDSKACTGLTISQDEIIMDEAGGKVFLTAVARPHDCEDAIVFSSTDESVAVVTENGMITAIGPGEAEIHVTCGTVTEVCTISCVFELQEPEPEEEPEQEPEPEETAAPSLSSVDFTLFYPGEETTLSVLNAPAGAVISYVSSDSKVVTVDQNGKVTAMGEGDATITVTVGDVTLTCAARCRMDGSAEGSAAGSYAGPFTISHEDVTLFSVGETFTLTLTDSTGKTVSGLSWTASNGAVSISGNQIKAVTAGQTTVSCVYNGETYRCIVRCTF